MRESRWDRLAELFAELTALQRHQRASALVAVCDGDLELQAELESLLVAHDVQSGPLETAPLLAAISGDEFAGLPHAALFAHRRRTR